MTVDPSPTSWPLRLWTAMPDGVFRVLGAGFFFLYLAGRVPEYANFPDIGPFWAPMTTTVSGLPAMGEKTYVPVAKILVDLTFLLVAVSFALRIPARTRATKARQIVVPLIAAFMPLVPFMLRDALGWLGMPQVAAVDAALAWRGLTWTSFTLGVGLIVAGNALDVWGYATLFRSLSITAEARELKTHGPYRFVRHPIYAGQFLAQAGVWLVLVNPWWFWQLFYVTFVALQLYRSKIEDAVLHATFGEAWEAFAKRAWWPV